MARHFPSADCPFLLLAVYLCGLLHAAPLPPSRATQALPAPQGSNLKRGANALNDRPQTFLDRYYGAGLQNQQKHTLGLRGSTITCKSRSHVTLNFAYIFLDTRLGHPCLTDRS